MFWQYRHFLLLSSWIDNGQLPSFFHLACHMFLWETCSFLKCTLSCIFLIWSAAASTSRSKLFELEKYIRWIVKWGNLVYTILKDILHIDLFFNLNASSTLGEPDAILQHATTKSLNLIFWCPSLTSVWPLVWGWVTSCIVF